MEKHLANRFLEQTLEAEAFETVDDFRQILLESIPIIDVRSPLEFAQGAVPNAVNLPLLNDGERKRVGIAYKEGGQVSAITKGLEILSNEVRDDRVVRWVRFLEHHPNALICCWRGGLRSRIVQMWLREAGWQVPRIVGGSKAIRTFCLDTIDAAGKHNYIVLAGRTGSGKTQLLRELQPSIDLEGLAHHRGSAFGGDTASQPPPVNFESTLTKDLLRFLHTRAILVEDESRVIGKLAIPESLFKKMGQSPVVVLHADQAERIQFIYHSYVRGTAENVMLSNLEKIQKRLGMEHYYEIRSSIKNAYHTDDREDHFSWLSLLLRYYYDPMYDYQLSRKEDRLIYSGPKSAVKEFLMTKCDLQVR
ncbi:MAG: tRNA 2-selenouridine(34) synthase MnmH [Gammaproteobacteria bacterium]|nr:tRNA 2-selenouridine(34) synthase MnmH [Gammaproteobacteria bacterium]